MRVFIGWDSREDIAYQVACESLLRNASPETAISVEPIKLRNMQDRELYWREVDPLASTEFTYTRFLTPLLAGNDGWALFCDCDFLFFGDVSDLEQYMDPKYSVLCVKHDYRPTEATKMDGKRQSVYPRKNWSSFMLFNCAHEHCLALTADKVNSASGAYLHQMQWTADECIGELPVEWNFLEGWNRSPEEGAPNAVHFTRGGPWFEQWRGVDFAAEWLEVARELGFRDVAA